MQRFADSSSPIEADLAMDAEELLGYLRNMDCNKFYVLEGILAQTEAIGDPALPTSEQRAILSWLDAATRDWDQHFALEEPLAGDLRRLRPLVAALAVTEPGFFTPGAHPLHQLLDTIQMHAIVWQERLGRVGRGRKEEVGGVVEAALAWFDSPATDLAAISAGMAASAAKASARARKMSQRLTEREHGRIRIAESKQAAALMINAVLEEYPAPVDIGQILKGPWYDSAQLVFMKFGRDSVEWKNMSRTTTLLLESLQNPVTEGEEQTGRRQHVFEMVSQLPKELGQWLLSLQHDGEAVSDTLERVEYFHSKVLRNQALEMEKISAIPLQNDHQSDQGPDEALSRVCEGQWFILNVDDSPALRAMVALRLDDEQELLFVNQAGIKVLKRSFTEFSQLMTEGRVTLLDSGASFSRCLARSVGLETEDDLAELTGVPVARARFNQEERKKAERERKRLERKKAERERIEQERERQEQEGREELERELEEAERLRQEYEEAERLKR